MCNIQVPIINNEQLFYWKQRFQFVWNLTNTYYFLFCLLLYLFCPQTPGTDLSALGSRWLSLAHLKRGNTCPHHFTLNQHLHSHSAAGHSSECVLHGGRQLPLKMDSHPHHALWPWGFPLGQHGLEPQLTWTKVLDKKRVQMGCWCPSGWCRWGVFLVFSVQKWEETLASPRSRWTWSSGGTCYASHGGWGLLYAFMPALCLSNSSGARVEVRATWLLPRSQGGWWSIKGWV